MAHQDPTLKILSEAISRATDIQLPTYLKDLYASTPIEKEKDEMNGATRIFDKALTLEKPAVCLLGAFNAGKTFLINYLINDEIFTSKIVPTTAAITVIRHIEDKPKTWPSDSNVYTLRNDVDLRTLEFASTTGSYSYEDLPRLTTYPEAVKHDAALVFIDHEILKKCTFYDCPGVGLMSESVQPEPSENEPKPTSAQLAVVREEQLQRKAIANADAYLLLSPLIGTGVFADSNTGKILYSIANNMSRFPVSTPHGNMLFVGSQADPTKKDLRDESAVLKILRTSIQKQVEKLPPNERQKFDIFELKKRIVLFYALDPYEEKSHNGRLVMTLKRSMQAASALDIQREAKAQFAEQRTTLERTAAFNAAIETLIDQLLFGMQEYRAQVSEQSVQTSLSHYQTKRAKYKKHVDYHHYYEALSLRYEQDRNSREKDWENLVGVFDLDIKRAENTTMQEFEKTLAYWGVKENVYRFLENEFGENKEQAKGHAAAKVSGRIQADFGVALQNSTSKPQQLTYKRLSDFDQKWLKRKAGSDEISAFRAGSPDVDQLELPNIDSISMAQTFTAVTAGIAGGTTLLAVGGSVLAQAAMAKVLAIGVFTASGIGMGATVSAVLLSIPVGGWIVLGVAGVVYSLWGALAWRDSLANKISKSLRSNKETTLVQARGQVGQVFTTMRKLGQESLEQSKAVLDGHIMEIHEIGKGKVTSADLERAVTFYDSHTKVLEQTLSKIKEGTWRNDFKNELGKQK